MLNDDDAEYGRLNPRSKRNVDCTNTNDTDKRMEENLMLRQREYVEPFHIANILELYRRRCKDAVGGAVGAVERRDRPTTNEAERRPLLPVRTSEGNAWRKALMDR